MTGPPGPGPCECMTLHGKWEFADIRKVRLLRWKNYLGLCRWAKGNHRVLIRGGIRVKGGDVMTETRLGDGGPQAKTRRRSLEAGKGKGWVLPWSPRKACSPAGPLQTSDLQICNRINLCSFKPLCGNVYGSNRKLIQAVVTSS